MPVPRCLYFIVPLIPADLVQDEKAARVLANAARAIGTDAHVVIGCSVCEMPDGEVRSLASSVAVFAGGEKMYQDLNKLNQAVQRMRRLLLTPTVHAMPREHLADELLSGSMTATFGSFAARKPYEEARAYVRGLRDQFEAGQSVFTQVRHMHFCGGRLDQELDTIVKKITSEDFYRRIGGPPDKES